METILIYPCSHCGKLLTSQRPGDLAEKIRVHLSSDCEKKEAA